MDFDDPLLWFKIESYTVLYFYISRLRMVVVDGRDHGFLGQSPMMRVLSKYCPGNGLLNTMFLKARSIEYCLYLL